MGTVIGTVTGTPPATASGLPIETATIETATIDGRRARRERGRTAVIDAAFDLLQEDAALPSVERVAARAGVSVASLYRYVQSLAALRRFAFERFFERYRHLIDPDIDQGIDERIDRGIDQGVDQGIEGVIDPGASRGRRIAGLVATRLELYEQAGSIMQLGRLRAIEDEQLVAAATALRTALADQVRRSLHPELSALPAGADEQLVAVVDGMISLDAWATMARIHGRSRPQIERAWERAVDSLVDTWTRAEHDVEHDVEHGVERDVGQHVERDVGYGVEQNVGQGVD